MARKTREKPIPKVPPLPDRKVEALTATEQWYFDCFVILSTHLKRPPSMPEFSVYTKRTVMPCYTALRRIAAKGRLDRQAGKFVIP